MDDSNNNERPVRQAGFVPFSLRGISEKVDSALEAASDKIEELVEELTPYEYSIEIGCHASVCKKLGIEKLFTLGQTNSEQAVKRFKLVEQGDTTLLVATVYSQEPKKLHVAAGSTSTELSVDDVQIDPVDTNKAREAFIPVHLGLEVGYRLGVSTKGYYYHFKDNKLLHEYKIQDNNKTSWAFHLTQSTADGLSDELLSDQPFTTMLLPWRALDQNCDTQHLLHSTEKLTDDTFNGIDAAWLEENALKVDLNAILAAQSEAPQPAIEPQPTEVIYVVKKGDKLENIAKNHDMTLSEILELNPEYQVSTRKDFIYPGDEIVVALESEESATRQQLRQKFHTVKKGDTLSQVAAQYGLSLDALIEMNPYFSYSKRKERIYPGDKIVVAEETVEVAAEHIVAAKDNEYGRETWADIAQQCNIPPKKLLELNPCYIGNESGLTVGDCIQTAPCQANDDSKERNTLPATETCDVNLTDNTSYKYRDMWLTEYVKPIVHSLFPVTSAVLRLATLRPKMNESIKLCLARYALDEVPADERSLEEKIAANEEDHVKTGKHPISDALLKAYNFAPSRYQDTTPHTLTVRQIRDGYVYVYYAPISHEVENQYEHAGKLFEYKKTGEYYEREGDSTPYLPCQSLPGHAYIVYSERQWTDRQKTQFTDEPDFRERATKTSGQIYPFLKLVNHDRTEQDTFTDFANLVADMDEGTAVQDGRFAGSVTPTQSDEAHQPVISNQSLLDTIEECAPVRADILVLDDPIALVEDTLVVTGKRMVELANWQEQNQNLHSLTQATAGFCHLQLKQSDSLAQELAKDPVKHAKAHAIISSYSLGSSHLESSSGHGETTLMIIVDNINQELKKEGITHPLYIDEDYLRQLRQKEKWRTRVRMEEMNEYFIHSTVQETFLRTRLNWASHFTLALLDAVGPDPSCLFFDLYEEDHASQYIATVTEWYTYLSPALNEQDRNTYNAQLRSQLALSNVMGSAMFAGVPEFKPFLAKLMDVVLSSYPNESFNQLANQVESEEALSDWLDKANELNMQSGRADQSAHVGALGALFDAFTNDELANFTFFKKTVQVPYSNVQNAFVKAAAGKLENLNVFSFNSWSTDVVLKEITESWKHQSRLKMDVIMPMVLSNQLSGREVTLTAENRRQLLKLGGQFDDTMAGIVVASEKLEQSRLPQDRATLSKQIEGFEAKAKKISGSMGKHITFTDAAKKAMRIENIWQPMAQKGVDFATGNALNGVVIVLNFLALQQDYERILTSPNPSDSDKLTLIYRPLWLMESVVRVSQGYYQAQVREAFSLLNDSRKTAGNINTRNIFKAIEDVDVALSKTLTKLLIFGVAAELTLVVAAIESYQIYTYDFMPSSGKVAVAHGMKLAGTSSMAISGGLGLIAVIFKFSAASMVSMAAVGLGVFGGIIYSAGTAYLNYVQDDDISEWLKKTYWGDKNKWEGAQVWGNTPEGHEKAFDELSVIRNQPKLYTQPTLKTPGEVSEENADGAWLMLELPSELNDQKLRVDVLVYPDRDQLITPDKDYQFFHIDTLGLDGSRQWQGEWIKGYRPQPHKNEMRQEVIPQLPETKVLTYSQGKSLQTWQPTENTQLLNLWLPRPWGSTGIWMFETCPAIMLVWYEYHLDKKTGKPKEGAVPHAFTLDLSLETDMFSDTELSNSLKQVNISDKEGFNAYSKAIALARGVKAPNLLNVGYSVDAS